MLFQNSKEQLTSILFGFLLILLFVIPIIIFGIEDIEDIIEDLSQALESTR